MLSTHGSVARVPARVPRALRPPDRTRKAWSALSLRAVSSGLSTGVCRVKRGSNWLTSSSDCCGQTQVGRGRGVSRMGVRHPPLGREDLHSPDRA